MSILIRVLSDFVGMLNLKKKNTIAGHHVKLCNWPVVCSEDIPRPDCPDCVCHWV